ncbi:hypothetical protein EsDP_00005788 [Epichloe bromicola]|uniref:Uncharacterized protein n=1 Tax=Epichloe bromicola TaxID=79588 RepID=A0ABQ0CVV4_9HYPO
MNILAKLLGDSSRSEPSARGLMRGADDEDAPERFVPLPPLPASEEGYGEGDEREGGFFTGIVQKDIPRTTPATPAISAVVRPFDGAALSLSKLMLEGVAVGEDGMSTVLKSEDVVVVAVVGSEMTLVQVDVGEDGMPTVLKSKDVIVVAVVVVAVVGSETTLVRVDVGPTALTLVVVVDVGDGDAHASDEVLATRRNGDRGSLGCRTMYSLSQLV